MYICYRVVQSAGLPAPALEALHVAAGLQAEGAHLVSLLVWVIYMHAKINERIHTSLSLSLSLYTYIYIYVYIYICIYIYICSVIYIYICMCMCIYIYIYICIFVSTSISMISVSSMQRWVLAFLLPGGRSRPPGSRRSATGPKYCYYYILLYYYDYYDVLLLLWLVLLIRVVDDLPLLPVLSADSNNVRVQYAVP